MQSRTISQQLSWSNLLNCLYVQTNLINNYLKKKIDWEKHIFLMNFSGNRLDFALLNPERASQDICGRGGSVIEERPHGKYKTNRGQSHTVSRSSLFLIDFLSIEVITKNILRSPRGETSVAVIASAVISATDQLKFWNLIVFMFCVFVLLYFCYASGGEALASWHGKCKNVLEIGQEWTVMLGMPDCVAFTQIWKWNQTLPLAPRQHLTAAETVRK